MLSRCHALSAFPSYLVALNCGPETVRQLEFGATGRVERRGRAREVAGPSSGPYTKVLLWSAASELFAQHGNSVQEVPHRLDIGSSVLRNSPSRGKKNTTGDFAQAPLNQTFFFS